MAYFANTCQVLELFFSADLCLAQLNDLVLLGMDKGMHTGMIPEGVMHPTPQNVFWKRWHVLASKNQ